MKKGLFFYQESESEHKGIFFALAFFALGLAGISLVYALQRTGPPIRSDGVGYYLYLPATFIYHDLGMQRIAEAHFNGHIPEWTGASLYSDTQNYLIKYPIGQAVLMLPFFLLACLTTFFTAAPMDGFSFPFQYAAALSGLFYTASGLALLWKLLERYFRQNTILFTLLGLVFGTNLFHYATYGSVFSHAYSFFLFCAFLYLVIEHIYDELSLKHCITIGAVAGLIIVTRPSNALWLLFGLLYGLTSFRGLLERMCFWKRNFKSALAVLIPFIGILALQMLYWKMVTGKAIIYSYGDEGFNFLQPEILNVLFSVRKGLFFWSPILLTVLPGLYFLRKKIPELFVPAILFLAANLYVISSWYCWWYGGSFGHRGFLESLPLFAICLCAFYEGIVPIMGKRILLVFGVLSSLYTTWLMLKYWTRVLPVDDVTWEYFINTFFILRYSML